MYRCIECGFPSQKIISKLSSTHHLVTCKNCNHPCDKYFEYTSIIKLIDLLLMKKQIFVHYIYNTSSSKLIFLYFILIFCKILYNLANFKISVLSTVFSELFYLSFLFVFYLDLKTLFFALTISNYYYLFLVLMIIWEYQNFVFYFLVEMLVVISNSVALSAIKKMSFLRSFFVIVFGKILVMVLILN